MWGKMWGTGTFRPGTRRKPRELAEEVRPVTNGLQAGALESWALIPQLRRGGRSREAGTGRGLQAFLIQIREMR